jgi:hypothetical protein
LREEKGRKEGGRDKEVRGEGKGGEGRRGEERRGEEERREMTEAEKGGNEHPLASEKESLQTQHIKMSSVFCGILPCNCLSDLM